LLGSVVLVVAAALWVRSELEGARAPVAGFCVTLRNGEPWAPAARRAEARSLRFQEVSRRGAEIQEYRAERDVLGKRFGCTVYVEAGRVATSVNSELPPE